MIRETKKDLLSHGSPAKPLDTMVDVLRRRAEGQEDTLLYTFLADGESAAIHTDLWRARGSARVGGVNSNPL